MTYFRDGAPYTYHGETGRPFRTGHPPPGFVDRLAWRCRNRQKRKMRGIHNCNLCPPGEGGGRSLLVDGKKHVLGAAEISVKTPGATYAAPDLVLHYAVDHRYLPPDDFVEALLAAPESESLPDWSIVTGPCWT